MVYQDWETKAREFLKTSHANLGSKEDPDKIRMKLIDIHAVLESTLRGYMVDIHNLEEAQDTSLVYFPKLIQSFQDVTGSWVIDAATAERLLFFNNLRNKVTHEGQVVTLAQIQEFIQITRRILNRLLPGWSVGIPIRPARRPLSLLSGTILTILVVLYAILPDLMPLNPIDDILIGCPGAAAAIILVILAYWQRGKTT